MAATKTNDYREANYRRACNRIERVHARLDELEKIYDANVPGADWQAVIDEIKQLQAERDQLNDTITTRNTYARAIR